MGMQRIFIIIFSCLLPLWTWGLYKQFSIADESAETKTPPMRTAPAKPLTRISLNPTTKHKQANLTAGYLFNSERFIQSTGTTNSEINNAAINMETLQYDGSIIIDETRKALISFATGRALPVQKQAAARRRVKASRVERRSKVISLGDTVAGYTTTAIEPLQLVFTRNGEKVKKDFFTDTKKRQASSVVKTTPPHPKAGTKQRRNNKSMKEIPFKEGVPPKQPPTSPRVFKGKQHH